MAELYSILVSCLALALIAVLWTHLRLRRRLDDQEARLAALTRRVFELEGGQTLTPVPPAVETAVDLPVLAPVPATGDTPTAPSFPPPTEDWEAVVGANWLNRIGALLLVIGIALFLGYSLTQLGPAGKVAIGLAVGASMLLGGVALRSHPRYGNFSVSLAGGGWAVLYFTAYAAHALEPARVITSPILGGIVLFTVSVGMILHAVSFQSEKGTLLAFLFSFVSLNISPLTGFSLYAALVLAVSMLLLAHLRDWLRVAVAGVVLSYVTFLLRRDPGQPLMEWALWIQWFAFEAFDLMNVSRRGISRSLFWLNACGFVGAALLHKWNDPGWFLFLSAAAYLASTYIRAQYLGGGYEGALTASAGLLAGGIMERLSGIGMVLALMVEGELIALAGHAMSANFVRLLGGAVLGIAFLRLTLIDALENPNVRVWTPTAAIFTGILIVNRLLFRSGWAYTAGAGVLWAILTAAELPRDWVPLAWSIPIPLGIWAGIAIQPIIGAFAAFIAAAASLGVLPVILTAAVFYACQFLDRSFARPVYSIFGTILLTILLFREAEGQLLTVALAAQGAASLIAGMFTSERVLRLSGLALFTISIGKAFVYDLRQLDTFGRILSFIGLGLLLLGASWVYTRYRERIKRLL